MINVANKRIIRTLAFRQIKAGETRNLFAIAAIVLTSVLITAVVTLGFNLMDANMQMMMKQSGQTAEVSFQYLAEDEAARIAAHPLVKEYGISKYIGFASGDEWSQTPLEIRTADAKHAEFTFSTPTAGRLPEAENEVAIKSWMLDALGLPREIGAAFPLSFMIGGTQHNLSLTVCGIWEDDYYIHPYGTAYISGTLADKLLAGTDIEESRHNGTYSGVIQLAANLNGRQGDLQGNLDKLTLEAGLDAELTAPRVNYAYASSASDTGTIAAIVLILVIVLISGYLLIYNIFYISVAMDIKHYGLLKTIGTTRAQIKRIVNIQAFIFCLIGIPIGLLLGYLLAVLLFPLMLAATTLDASLSTSATNPLIFLAAALLALITVFISCNHPARIAGRISPVEATRYTAASTQKRTTKSGYNGASVARMAYANLFRNRKKTIITLASVSFGLILFNVVFTFTNSFDVDKTVAGFIQGDFLIADGSYFSGGNSYYSPTYTLTEEAIEKLAGLDGAAHVAEVYHEVAEGQTAGAGTPVPALTYGLDEHWLDILEGNVVAGVFDRGKFLSGEYIVIGADMQNSLSVGDTVNLNFKGESGGKQYEVMAKVDYSGAVNVLSAKYITGAGFSAYLPETEFTALPKANIMSATVIADGGNAAWLGENIKAVLAGIPELDFRSRTDYEAEMENSNRQIAFVGVALCVIILLIGVLNFVNTVITNILSRKYEFAMLQAIGMTARQSKNMLVLECVYFELIAAAIFISVGYGASFGIVRLLAENTAAYTYEFTALPFLFCFPLLGLIAFALPRQIYRGISKNSVVERLREIE
ncbi:MAG: ABC transporter permease [Clostridiales bacterium]|jgi:putative ABC transport system permease protein|nr:ABC transporter permease [Clostridiales bacterium]